MENENRKQAEQIEELNKLKIQFEKRNVINKTDETDETKRFGQIDISRTNVKTCLYIINGLIHIRTGSSFLRDLFSFAIEQI